MFIGDLNYDMLVVPDKSTPLQNVCDNFDLTKYRLNNSFP